MKYDRSVSDMLSDLVPDTEISESPVVYDWICPDPNLSKL